MGNLYATIRNLSGKYSKLDSLVKDKDGQLISDLEGQKRRWLEHFEELLNRPVPPDPPYSQLTVIYPLTVHVVHPQRRRFKMLSSS